MLFQGFGTKIIKKLTVVTPTDRPKSVRCRCVLEVLVLSRCFLDFSVGVRVFIIGLGKISSFFSYDVKASAHVFKLPCTTCLGTSTATIFLLNDHSLYALMTLDNCHAWFYLYGIQLTGQRRVESDKTQNKKLFPALGLEPTTLRFVAWCYTDRAIRAFMKAVF